MKKCKSSVTLSLAVCYALCGIVTAGLFLGPWVVKLICLSCGIGEGSEALMFHQRLFACCYYPGAALGYVTIYSLVRLLRNIQKDAVFITPNVRYLRRISYCCLMASAIALAAACFFLPYLFMTVAAGFVGLMLQVVKSVMENAVELKEENELTI